MRIVHYLSAFRLADGGVVRSVLDLTALLAARGHEVFVLTRDASDVPPSWRQAVSGAPLLVELSRPPRLAGRFDRESMKEARRLIAEAHVVHLHAPWDVANLQFARLARRAKVPYVVTAHGMLDDWSMAQRGAKKRAYLAMFGRRLLERAAFVHCTAQAEQEQARRWFPRGRSCVVPYVVDLDPFRTLPGDALIRQRLPQTDTDRPVVLFLSRLHVKKRPEALIDAAAILRTRDRPLRVIIAGSGDDDYVRSLHARIDRAGLREDAHLVGLVVGDEKLSLYQRADVFAMATSQENFGLVYTEAMSCGTPVIATKGTDIWRELEASGGAIVVDGSPRSIADAIQRLLDDRPLLERMGRAGREWMFREFDGDRIVARFEDMYGRCAAA